ncbi:glycerol kinase GlpK [Marinithermus hydrothermalis]|uniref:Glycerol kinase n=1 Tax=Marinithermus hydrothermalis (strain DSM 14884 / JCM 11576 / T1) TaxID=869210 RepID=F2NQ99_MARHT|nr:glycerol kinase GlpK [Marinithermus hydrothermalis]AEB11410.1 Glycerol kinase [Marinithermus hydrothermalis DSM 14884]
MPYILALDQGTTSSRAIVFDLHGRPVAQAQREFTQHYPRPGWVEHDPVEIWETQLATARQALEQAGISAQEVAALGITNQRETTLLWERSTGRPVANAIVWQDRRTAPICGALKVQGLEPTVRAKTGLVLDPYFSGTKLRWLLEQHPNLKARAASGELAFGTVDSWLIWNLTGGRVHATDVTNAARTLLFNIHTLSWDPELLEALEIPAALLPEVRPSAGRFGETDPALFGAAIPITGVAGDQQAALFGQACVEPGLAKNTYGTGAFVVMHTGAQAVTGDGVLTTLAWQLEGHPPAYALEGSIFIAGAAVQWLRDGLGIIERSAEVEALARSVPDAGGVYFVPALVGLGAPHWDPYARGLLIGLTRGTTKAHIARAALEAIAYQTADAIRAMEAASGLRLKELRVDGGAAANDLLLEFQADLLNAAVLRPKVTETTALGAAYLAAVGAGMLSVPEVQARWALERRFEPRMDPARREALYAGWRRAVERARGWSSA